MEELFDIVVEFCKAIEKAMSEGEFARDLSFNHFPRGCCGDATDLLGHYLLTQGIIPSMFMVIIMVTMKPMGSHMRGYY